MRNAIICSLALALMAAQAHGEEQARVAAEQQLRSALAAEKARDVKPSPVEARVIPARVVSARPVLVRETTARGVLAARLAEVVAGRALIGWGAPYLATALHARAILGLVPADVSPKSPAPVRWVFEGNRTLVDVPRETGKVADGTMVRLDVEAPGAAYWLGYLARTRHLAGVVLYATETRDLTGREYRRQLQLMREVEREIRAEYPILPVGITVATAPHYRNEWARVARGWEPDFLAVYGVGGLWANYARVLEMFPGRPLVLAEVSGVPEEFRPAMADKLLSQGFLGVVFY